MGVTPPPPRPEVNSIAFNVREFLERFCLVLRLFQVQLNIIMCPGTLYCLVVFINWNGHCGKLPCVAFFGKLVQSIGDTDNCTRAAVEF